MAAVESAAESDAGMLPCPPPSHIIALHVRRPQPQHRQYLADQHCVHILPFPLALLLVLVSFSLSLEDCELSVASFPLSLLKSLSHLRFSLSASTSTSSTTPCSFHCLRRISSEKANGVQAKEVRQQRVGERVRHAST